MTRIGLRWGLAARSCVDIVVMLSVEKQCHEGNCDCFSVLAILSRVSIIAEPLTAASFSPIC